MPPIQTRTTTLMSLAVVKNYLKVTDTTRDDILAFIADAVSERMERDTGRFFVKRTGITEMWSGDGRNLRFLRYRPIIGVASLSVSGNVIDPSQIVIFDEIGEIALRSQCFYKGDPGNCLVTYDAGFDDQDGPALPADVYQAALDYTKAVYSELTANSIAASTVSIGAAQMVIKAGLPPGIQRVITDWVDTRQ